MRADPDDFAHSLIPVTLAAQLVWARVYQGCPPALENELLLNAIASNLMVHGRIFEYQEDPSRGVRRLCRSEIEGGAFCGGGRELHFSDGRPPRRYLAVPTEAVPKTIEALTAGRLW